jgi:hypothetical protein
MSFVDRGHLGGYMEGGDPATFYPAVWDWLVRHRHVRSVLDIGCGDGVAVRYFRDTLGIKATGIDGVEQPDKAIHTHDFTKGKDPLKKSRGYDLVWSCEFLEHVEARYLPNVAPSFQRAPLVLVTHAEPGQPGHHHVNCQPAEYWVGWFSALGYTKDEQTTEFTRKLASMNPDPHNHYARSGLVFRRD